MRVEKSKDKILLRAKEMFFKSGYTDVSMDAIVKSLGMSKATIYRHYKSKDQLFMELAADFFNSVNTLLNTIINNNQLNYKEKLSEFIKVRAQALSSVSPLLMLDLKAKEPIIYEEVLKMRKDLIENEFRAFLVYGQEISAIKKEVNIDVTTQMVLFTITHLTSPESMQVHGLSYGDCFREVLEIIWNGIKNKEEK